MAAKTDAQEEFDSLFKTSNSGTTHPEDRDDQDSNSDVDEETQHNRDKVDATMRMPVFDNGFHLPLSSFDPDSRTGVKGVIADARSYDEARKQSFFKTNRQNNINKSTERRELLSNGQDKHWEEDEVDLLEDDDEFLEQWRRSRKAEIEDKSNDIRGHQRRTSPSMRRYGQFDEVDMLGYLDSIEKVPQDTVVVVFVYDDEVRLLATLLHTES